MSDHQPDGVIRLETKQQRADRQDQEYRDEVQREALTMLEMMIGLVKERRISGLAIAFAWEDGYYGRLLPTLTSNMAALIGSLGTAHHALIASTLFSDESAERQ